MKIPNIPNLIGKGIGRVLHAPVDLAKGVKEGFTKAGTDEHEQVEQLGEPVPSKPSFAKQTPIDVNQD